MRFEIKVRVAVHVKLLSGWSSRETPLRSTTRELTSVHTLYCEQSSRQRPTPTALAGECPESYHAAGPRLTLLSSFLFGSAHALFLRPSLARSHLVPPPRSKLAHPRRSRIARIADTSLDTVSKTYRATFLFATFTHTHTDTHTSTRTLLRNVLDHLSRHSVSREPVFE